MIKWWELPVADLDSTVELSNLKSKKKSKPGAKKRRAKEKRQRKLLCESRKPIATLSDLWDDQK